MDLKIGTHTVLYYLGYIARFQKENIKDIDKKVENVEELIQRFTLLKPYWRNSGKLANEAKKNI